MEDPCKGEQNKKKALRREREIKARFSLSEILTSIRNTNGVLALNHDLSTFFHQLTLN